MNLPRDRSESDEGIFRWLNAGNHELRMQAIEALWQKYHTRIYAHLYRSQPNLSPQDYEDLIQQLIQVVCKQATPNQPENASDLFPWLRGIANNLINDFWRKQKRELRGIANWVQANQERPDQDYKFLLDYLLTRLDKVHGKNYNHHRDIDWFLLHIWEKMSYADIAKTAGSGISKETVRKSVKRVALKAKRLIHQEIGVESYPMHEVVDVEDILDSFTIYG